VKHFTSFGDLTTPEDPLAYPADRLRRICWSVRMSACRSAAFKGGERPFGDLAERTVVQAVPIWSAPAR